MEKLDKKEIELLDLKSVKGQILNPLAHEVYKAVDLLAVGDGVRVEKSEWPYKHQPSQSNFPRKVRTMGRTYTVRTTRDNQSFVIIRTA